MAKSADQHEKAILIFNPGAGKGNPKSRLVQAVDCLQRHGIPVEVVVARPARRATVLARSAVRVGHRLVIAMGGDGTVEAAARGLVGTKTRLGILPAGTFNNVATSLGIPEDLNAACQILAEGNHRRIDVGQAKSKKHGTVYFFEAAVVGLEAALYPAGAAAAKRNWRRLVSALGTLLIFRTPKMTVRLDGKRKIAADSLLAVVANTPNFGATYLVAPDAAVDDGKLDVGLYAGFSKPDLIAYFAEVAGERSEGQGHVQRYQARKVRIKARPRQIVMADNQRLGKGTVTIKVLPRALRVIAPEDGAVPVDRKAKEQTAAQGAA